MSQPNKALSFFRVFDLAFFAPGMVVGLSVAWRLRADVHRLAQQDTSVAAGLVAIVALLGVVYVMGLMVFAGTWVFVRVLKGGEKVDTKATKPPSRLPFPCHFQDPTRTDLALYFWYLRGTCWSVGVALVLSAAIVVSDTLPRMFSSYTEAIHLYSWHPNPAEFILKIIRHLTPLEVLIVTSTELLGALLLVWLGCQYDKSLDRCWIFIEEESVSS